VLIRISSDFILLLAMKTITGREPIMALLAEAVLIIGISTIYSISSGSGPSAAYAAAQTFTGVVKIPVDTTDFVPCAAGGAGEEVHLTGEIHDLFHITLDSAGGAHVKVQLSDQGISGTGLTTGDKYHRTGATNFEFNAKVGEQTTVVNNFDIIGQGNGNNFLLHVTLHITVNANGTVTAEVVNTSVECK
jgi:hypothetical protein